MYIRTDDASLIAHGNYAVYVPLQQVAAYMQAVTWVSYAAVFGGLIMLWSGLVAYVEYKERSSHE
ncbi:MAG: hypothetical protein M1357_02955 [Candidatus Marsarchaeota archaeon]|nr:hypothetical protein [Candidatus Marsarchaeota archaeon]